MCRSECRKFHLRFKISWGCMPPDFPPPPLGRFGYTMLTTLSLLCTKMRSTPFTNISMNRTLTYPIHVQFTKEIEENGKLPFLDCLVIRDNNKIWTTVYRKLTHTNRLLNQSSYNPTSHKATTIKTLTRWAQLVCDETIHLEHILQKNNYNPDFIKLSQKHWTWQDNQQPNSVTTVTTPYIKGTSETIVWVLQPHNIHVAHKPITTLPHLLTNVKDKDQPHNRLQGAVYRIKCTDYQATCIGETGRNLKTRLTEHKRVTKNSDIRDHISEYHRLTKHKINWMCHLQYKLPTTTHIRKLVHKLRTRISELMSTATCTLQMTHTWTQTKPTNKW